MISEEIRQTILREIREQHLSKEDVAKRAGVTPRLLEYWEQGSRKCTNVETVDRVLKALNCEFVIGGKIKIESEPRKIKIPKINERGRNCISKTTEK